ncbi:MAG: proline racemase family protein, partial [Allorhizobium sp.]
MRWKRTLQLLDGHAEGEIGRVAVGGVPKIPGDTVAEQLLWLNTDPKGEALRRMLVL